MPLSILCDEHIPYPVAEGLERRGIDVVVAQQVGLGATDDALIMAAAQQQGRVVYTGDDDYLSLSSSGVQHNGLFYHHPSKYSIGEAVAAVELACRVFSAEEMRNRVKFL